MPVWYRDEMAGAYIGDEGFRCFRCLPEKIEPGTIELGAVVSWWEFEDGSAVLAVCDKCDQEVKLSDRPTEDMCDECSEMATTRGAVH